LQRGEYGHYLLTYYMVTVGSSCLWLMGQDDLPTERWNSVLLLVAGDSGIGQTPTLGHGDMSSRAVEFERALMVLEIAGE